jgi:hypothetical protein
VPALLQLFQRREEQREEQRREERREDRREAAAREERLEARFAEREARLDARLLQPPSLTSVGYRIGAAAKDFCPFEGKRPTSWS